MYPNYSSLQHVINITSIEWLLILIFSIHRFQPSCCHFLAIWPEAPELLSFFAKWDSNTYITGLCNTLTYNISKTQHAVCDTDAQQILVLSLPRPKLTHTHAHTHMHTHSDSQTCAYPHHRYIKELFDLDWKLFSILAQSWYFFLSY